MEIQWEDPPEGIGRGRYDRTSPVLAALKGNPGRWAKVASGRKSSSAGTTFRKKGCEVQTHRESDGTYTVWARWPMAEAS